ncbi:GAP family protein [Salinibacterium sp. ZJ450]|uniref:GAP family protein n=1 Tax=Salinibacterium sp. ZJ450 TaxID=2708338 RepID=UPI00141DBAD2|nr:GAP family protein [Salinibacterium sp. ZJ450]
MTSVIGQILPLAVAVALSSVPIITALLILLSPARPVVSVALLVGWAFGVGAVLGLFTLGFGLASLTSRTGDDTAAGIVRILVGTALIAYSIRRFRRRVHHASHVTPKWMAKVGRLNAPGALAFGFLLALRPKNLILSIAASVVIGDASLSLANTLIVIAIFTLIGISTVAAPTVAHLAQPERTREPLNSMREWIIDNSTNLIFILVIFVGVVIISSGIEKL